MVCGLSLLLAVPEAGAAAKKPSGKPAAIDKASKSPKPAKTSRKTVGKGSAIAGAEIGLADIVDRDQSGLHGHASFYGPGFQGRKTATGERFDVRQFTGASNHFPLGSKVAVRRLDNDRCAVVRVNDRMHAKHRKRVIDVSRGVAEYLDMIRAGVVLVRVAPIKRQGGSNDSAGCHAAFEVEESCVSCGQPQKLPDFGSLLPP